MSPKMFNAPSTLSYNKLLGLLRKGLSVDFEFKRVPLLTVAHGVLSSGRHLRVIRYAERWGIAVAIYDSQDSQVLEHWVYPDIDVTIIIESIKKGEVDKGETCVL